jgi:type I restriction enzyme S subunit
MTSEWPLTTIGEHVDLITGEAFQSARFETAPSNGVRLARGDNVKEGEFEWGEKSRFWPELTPDLERYLLSEGDVLLGMDGSKVGKNWVRVRREDLPCLLVQRVARLRAKPTMHQGFLRYLIGNPMFKDYVARVRTGTSIPHISGGQIRSYQICLPPLPEQRAIASVLGALDDKIDLNRRMCQTLEEMARALFKSWFVDFDPVRAKMEGRDPGLPKEIADLFPSRLVDSELGPIPEGWRVADFGTIACQSRDLAQSEGLDARTNYIGLEHMPRRSIALANWGTGEAVESSKFRFTAGDILFGKLRPYFHKVGVAPIDGVCSTDIVVARPSTPELFGVTIGVMSSDSFVAHTDRSSAGTRMPRTNWADMSAFRIVTPSHDVAEVHTRAVKSMVDRIVLCIHESRTLAALRDTLLPKLISGEVRVPASLGSMQESSA